MTDEPRTGKVIRASLHGDNANGNVGDAVREILVGGPAAHQPGSNGDGKPPETEADCQWVPIPAVDFGGEWVALSADERAASKVGKDIDGLKRAGTALADAVEGGNADAIAAARETFQRIEDEFYGFESTGDPKSDDWIRPEFYYELQQFWQEGIKKGEWTPGDPATPEGRETRRRFFARCGQRQFLTRLLVDRQTFEIRAIFGPNDAKSRICHSIDEAIVAAQEFEGAKGIYFTLNPLRADLKKPAKDADVVKRHLLLVDIDPTRSEKGELSSTNDEKKAAIELAGAIAKWLMVRGWAQPIVIDSGNGVHLLFWIDLPNDAASHDLVKAVLTRLAKRFNTDRAKVDTTVHNAARISKLPYTMVRKGPDTAERPHRMAEVIRIPDSFEIVTREKLEALVEDVAAAQTSEPETRSQTDSEKTSGFKAKAGGQTIGAMTRDEYGQSELKKEIDQFAAARHPGRHADLLRCSLSLAGLVAAGVLSDQDAIRGLYSAARGNGMEGENRLGEVAEAWKSAREKSDARILPYWVVEPSANGTADSPSETTDREWKPPAGRLATDKELAHRPRTDLGNGERLVARFGANLHYCHPWRKWLHFDRQRWRVDDTAAVHQLAKRTVRAILKEAATIADDDKRKAHNAWWCTSEGKARVEAMLSLASSENGIPILPDDMDRDRFLLNVENGTIDLRTGTLRPHQREDLITRLAPIKFLGDTKCPTWLGVLDKIFASDPGLIKFWKTLCGICLTGDVSNQILPVLYGPGANGKTTLLTVLLEILGPEYAIVAPPGLLTLKKGERHPTELASLFNKRLAVDSETAEDARLNENLVKQLTGGDKISARRMREDFWEFSPTHKILMCTNHKPEIRETKNAIWRRVKLVPFNVVIPEAEQDAKLPDKLRAEYPGILAWCVEGCLDWIEVGLEIPAAVEVATAEYKRESDVIGEFLASECTIDPNMPGLRVRATPLYTRYQKWAGADAVNQRKFGKAMKERGFRTNKNSVIEYEGVGLKSEPVQDKSGQNNDDDDDDDDASVT